MLIYATTTQLATWLGTDVPANNKSLLRSASLLIADEIKAAYYTTDDTGLPTDAALLQALADATCSQCEVWIGLGIDPQLMGLDGKGPVKSSTILGAQVVRDTSAASSAAAFASRQAAAYCLADQPARILRDAGLLTTRVWSYG